MYDQTEPVIPFSSFKTEYERQFGADILHISPRPSLRRRSTSLKLLDASIDDLNMVGTTITSEQHSEYKPYTESDVLR